MHHHTSFLLLATLLSLSVSGTSHLPRRRHHARHPSFVKFSPPVDLAVSDTLAQRDDDACEYGTWRCQGAELQRCFNDSWNTMRNCTSDMVCSVDPEKTGCIWPWQADSSDSAAVTDSASSSSDSAAALTYVAVDDVASSSSSFGISTSATQTQTTQSSTAALETTTLTPTNPWSTIVPTATRSVIGGAFFHWQGASASDSFSTSSSTSSSNINTASSTSEWSWNSGSVVPTAGHSSSSSWTNTWWTPSPTDAAAQSTSTSGSSTSTKRRESKTLSSASSTSTDVWGNNIPTSSATAISSSAAAASTSTTSTSTTSNNLAAPHYVIYSDAWLTSMPSLSEVSGYNRFILAFWLSNIGAADNALFWSSLTRTERLAVKAEYNAAGVAVMVSAFGATDNPTTQGVDPTTCAQNLATFVKTYNLDGVDIDYEDSNAFNTGVAEAWLITFQTVLRQLLPTPYIISHAPQAPWFTSTGQYTGGGYTKVHAAVGDGIDFYNIQFYNQGDIYTDCDSLITTSGGSFPSTSVFEINSYSSVPLSKIVIGKPLDSGAAANGYMDSTMLAQCVKQAKAKGWNGGVMYWEFQKTLATLSMLAVVSL